MSRSQSVQSRSAWAASEPGIDNDVFISDHTNDVIVSRHPSVGMDTDPPVVTMDTSSPAVMPVDDHGEECSEFEKLTAEESREATNCCISFGRAVRGIWQTRHTEETTKSLDLHVKTTLRELLIYLGFLLIICIITFAMTSSTMYYYTKVMSELFLDAPFVDTKNTYRKMTTMGDFWRFAEGPLLDGLYWETWYNNRNLSREEIGYIFYENKLLGIPRIRQLKVRNDSCTVYDKFDIPDCYSVYSEKDEFTEPFSIGTGPAWTYQTSAQLKGSSHVGLLATYGGGGYVQDLLSTKAASLQLIRALKDNLWIDRGTRAVFIDFTVYNGNINLFCVVRMLIEFPATGGVISSQTFRTVKLIRYVSSLDFFVLACEIIFLLYLLYYFIEESIEIKHHKLSYFKSFWNILDVLVVLLSLCCVGFNVYRTIQVSSLLDSLLVNPNTYPDFEFLSYWQVVFNSTLAIMVFLAWVKIFKYISFNKTMTQLSTTLSACAKDLAGFAIMFFLLFFAFAQLGLLIFGTQVKDFSSFSDSVFTLFRIILGDFNFRELQMANRILGPAYFILYVFFVFFVLLNMFLAIINDTYSQVKSDQAKQKNEFEMSEFFKKLSDKMMDKFNIKRTKILDVQNALDFADSNNDDRLDLDEWRQSLKVRGYADAEIEAVFAKYDMDGDRSLNKEERDQMQADLDGQINALQEEYKKEKAEAEEEAPVSRPARYSESGRTHDDPPPRHTIPDLSRRDFNQLAQRVDKLEVAIAGIVEKIDGVLEKLVDMEGARSKRRETMTRILNAITEKEEKEGRNLETIIQDAIDSDNKQ